MRSLLSTLAIMLVSALSLHAQVCTPDETFRDSTGGVYPVPVSDENPEGGIQVAGCPGQEYFFSFTVKVPKTFEFGGTPITVTSIRLRTDTPIQGLPNGLSYACAAPPTCTMLADSLGCIAITGTINAAVQPGNYPLTILIDLVTSFGAIPTQFPNSLIAPGEYILKVEDSGSDYCRSLSVHRLPVVQEAVQVFPNPGYGAVQLRLDNSWTQEKTAIRWFDAMGRQVHAQEEYPAGSGSVLISSDLSRLPAGCYSYEVSNRVQRSTGTYIKL